MGRHELAEVTPWAGAGRVLRQRQTLISPLHSSSSHPKTPPWNNGAGWEWKAQGGQGPRKKEDREKGTNST